MTPQEHQKLLNDNVTKSYQKSPAKVQHCINLEAKSIANSFGIEKRTERLANATAFVTLKDHKENFLTKPTCRLINPCKSELGAITKSILDRINTKIREKLELNQWRNTDEVIEWFVPIDDKHKCSFIQLDIKEFYPSITKNILNQAIIFAKKHTTVTDKDIRTINHCRKSLLFQNEDALKKENITRLF